MLLDDEESANEMLELLLMDIGGVEIASVHTNPFAFLEEMRAREEANELPDVVFIDIDMPGMYGMNVAERVKELKRDVHVVFVTAYSEYAVEAFELHAMDYILKPTVKSRLEKTLHRLRSSQTQVRAEPKAEGAARIQCMGEFAIFSPDSVRIKWRTSKARELCAYMIHQHARLVGTEQLIELLFQGEDPEKAKVHLYTTISYVRKMFKQLGHPQLLRKTDHGYVLSLDGLPCDSLELELLVADSLQAVHAGNIGAFERIYGLYAGEYLPAFDHIDILSKREQLRRLTINALRRMRDYYESEGAMHRLSECLCKLVELAPDSEQDVLALMSAYARQGLRAEAIGVYQRLADRLEQEYGISPGEELVRFVGEMSSRMES
ncbi:response regulator [Paenibacillus sp. PL2-23]|uniref:response regulator n=1 Tax=Paenibacillus sp. PL2-23 TaxID=2100729 RepID=UPI0030FAFE44